MRLNGYTKAWCAGAASYSDFQCPPGLPAQGNAAYAMGIWLAIFEALAKVLPEQSARAMAAAVRLGTGFAHSGGDASFHGGLCRLRITNQQGYAHLVYLRMEWGAGTPFLAELNDNDFELSPNETRDVELRWRSTNSQAEVHGTWNLNAANAAETRQPF